MANPEGAFAKDLGYLAKFFDKLEAHASQVPAEHQKRYRTLIAEERTRWQEITAILSGAPAPAAVARSAGRVAPPEQPAAAPANTGDVSLTVGSLRNG